MQWRKQKSSYAVTTASGGLVFFARRIRAPTLNPGRACCHACSWKKKSLLRTEDDAQNPKALTVALPRVQQEEVPFAHDIAPYPVVRAPAKAPSFAERGEVRARLRVPICYRCANMSGHITTRP